MVRAQTDPAVLSLPRISEPQLRHYIELDAVRAIEAVPGVGGYFVIVHPKFPSKPLLMQTRRGEPRAWASLDRLVTYIEKMCVAVDEITVTLSSRGRRDEGD